MAAHPDLRKISPNPAVPLLRRLGVAQDLRRFLIAYGDDVTPARAAAAVPLLDLSAWHIYVDGRGIAAAVKLALGTDWYSCTLKNAAVRPDLRGKGVGKFVYADALDHVASRGCHIVMADINHDNEPSIKAAARAGFKIVDRFCYKNGEKPVVVMHRVRSRPTERNECLAFTHLGG